MKRLELTDEEAVALKICLFNQGSQMKDLVPRLPGDVSYLHEQLKLLESIWYKLKED